MKTDLKFLHLSLNPTYLHPNRSTLTLNLTPCFFPFYPPSLHHKRMSYTSPKYLSLLIGYRIKKSAKKMKRTPLGRGK